VIGPSSGVAFSSPLAPCDAHMFGIRLALDKLYVMVCGYHHVTGPGTHNYRGHVMWRGLAMTYRGERSGAASSYRGPCRVGTLWRQMGCMWTVHYCTRLSVISNVRHVGCCSSWPHAHCSAGRPTGRQQQARPDQESIEISVSLIDDWQPKQLCGSQIVEAHFQPQSNWYFK
jgi:hypothetical protein